MSTLYYQGLAPAVAQVSTQTFGTYDATTTRKITIGGVTVQAVDSGGNLTAALTALAVALNASTHPYFSTITWTSTSTTIQGTADTAGVPFTMTGAVSGGTGTVSNSGVQVDTTASSGPNDWSTAANWSGGVVPASGDTVIFANSAVNVCWGLTTGVTGVTVIRCEQTYTGKIGLNYLAFATSSDGATVNTSYLEYRPLYAAIGVVSLRIGDSSSIGSPSGSTRLMFNLGTTTACTVEVVNTASSSADTNRPAIRLLGVKTTHALNIRSGAGGVGICNEVPGEVSTFGTINISDVTGTTKFVSGRGLTINTSYVQDGGNNVLQSDQTVPLVTVNGGTLRTEGSGALTIGNALGGTWNSNHSGTTATLNVNGGAITSWGSAVARTWTTVNLYPRSTLTVDSAVVTLTNGVTVNGRVSMAT